MALQRLKEAAEKTKHELSSSLETGDQPPVHRAERQGRAAPHRAVDDALGARAPHERSHRADDRALPEGARRRQVHAHGHSQRHPRRRDDPDARRAEDRQAVLREGASQGRQPRRGGRGRRRPPGHGAQRRQGRGVAARRDAALDRRRDGRRRLHHAHRAQHDGAHGEERDLHHQRGQPVVRPRARPSGRAQDGRGQPEPGALRARRNPPGAARRAEDPGHVPHRRGRPRQRRGEGSRHGQGAARSG